MIRKIYNFIFAPPFDGFGPLIVNVLILCILVQLVRRYFSPEYALYLGFIVSPLFGLMREYCKSLSNWPERQ